MNSSEHRPRFFIARYLAMLMLLAAVTACQAKPEFLDLFKKNYKFSPTSPLGQAECAICHDGPPPKRNPYGRDLDKLILASSDKNLTVDMLKQVEGLDSDGDGWSNGDEIKLGYLPGDPASHPPGTPPPAAKTAATASGGSLIPTHAFHPVVVHFPIALFIFGVFLEFMGIWKKNPALTVAALWNLVGALASMAVVAPTGIAAWLLGGHKLEGDMLIHLLLAIGSLLLMSLTLVARKKAGNAGKAYWTILILTAVIVGLTGHFGGQLVYG